ncbi:hypothetical protein DL96DRAFT_1676054 [Flagelloscypha sp. PMI_526]|nr:hypothetical protein DL96DRAFT_1676054 [Flagelloscypha sp. PMI_526]
MPLLARADRDDSLHRIAQNAHGHNHDDATAIPTPIPDTGFPSTSLNTLPSATLTSSPSAISTLQLWSLSSPLATSIPLTVSPSLSTRQSFTLSSSLAAQSSLVSSAEKKHLSLPIIVAIASSSAALVLGALFLIKRCTRRRRRPLPVPSRPIFADSDDDVKPAPDSPLFGGGEERFSQNNHNNVPWTNYPHVPRNALAQTVERKQYLQEAIVMPTIEGYSHSIPPPDYTSQRSRNHSPRSRRMRPRSDTSLLADPISSRLITTPLLVPPIPSRPTSVHAAVEKELPYDGADVTSPVLAPDPPRSPGLSRNQIQMEEELEYVRHTSQQDHNSFDSQGSVTIKSEARRARDTKALTSALGFSSPTLGYSSLGSPATIYPDDSLSMIYELPLNRRSSHFAASLEPVPPMPSSTALLPEHDTGSALGNLMLTDYSVTSKSLVAMGLTKGSSTSRFSHSQAPAASNVNLSPSFRVPRKAPRQSLSDNVAPRVPSPPPFPSLSQMALEQSNPQSYTEYRSPTYSIYDLYRGDRKSRI